MTGDNRHYIIGDITKITMWFRSCQISTISAFVADYKAQAYALCIIGDIADHECLTILSTIKLRYIQAFTPELFCWESFPCCDIMGSSANT